MPNSSDIYYVNATRLRDAVCAGNWWVSGGLGYPQPYSVRLHKQLTFSNGQRLFVERSGTFNMLRPSARVTAVTGTATLDFNYKKAQTCSGLFGLHFGVPSNCGDAAGITFSRTVTVPAPFSGDFQWVQVIRSFTRRYQANDGSDLRFIWSDGNGLDGSYPYPPYPTPDKTEDSPGISVDDGLLSCWFSKYVTDADNFDTWLEFKPTGGHWVPLRKVRWSWSGEATLTGANCNQSDWTTSFQWTENPNDAETEEYPAWIKIITNIPDYQLEEL